MPREHRDKGEPIAKGQPRDDDLGVDKRQGIGRRSIDRLLSSGFDTVIRGIQFSPTLNAQGETSDSGSLDFMFTVQIGRVLYKKAEELSEKEKGLGIWAVADHVLIPQGKHMGDMLVLPISAGPSLDERYLIDIVGNTGSTEVNLLLYVAKDGDKKAVRTATIPASRLTKQGLDLNPLNSDNHGKTLRPNLTQSIFLPFLTGKALSTSQEQLTNRRTLGQQPSSNDLIPPSYSIPVIVETNKEVAYLSLMENYLTLAIALGPQSSIAELKEQADQELTAYLNTNDTEAKRKMEHDLRKQLDDLQTTGFERTVEMLMRFKKDAGESEAEVYHFEEEQRIRFLSTKKDRKTRMLLGLIREKQRLAVENLEYYIDVWKTIFPVGPRTLFWTKTIEHAQDNQVTKAEISEGLRDELGKKLIAQFNDYLRQWQTSSIDLRMPSDEAEKKTHQRMDTFRSSPLPVKVELIKDIEIRANAALLAAFPINIKLLDLLIDGEQKETGDQLSSSYSNAPMEGKIRLARKLFRDVEEQMEIRRKAYSKQVYQGLREKGLSRADATFELPKSLERLAMLPRLEQLRIMSTHELPLAFS